MGTENIQEKRSFFDQIKPIAENFRKYITGLYKETGHIALRSELSSLNPEESTRKILAEKFETAVASILDKQKSSSLYPPQVIQTDSSYKGKLEATNCIETAIHDLLNIMLYDPNRTFPEVEKV